MLRTPFALSSFSSCFFFLEAFRHSSINLQSASLRSNRNGSPHSALVNMHSLSLSGTLNMQRLSRVPLSPFGTPGAQIFGYSIDALRSECSAFRSRLRKARSSDQSPFNRQDDCRLSSIHTRHKNFAAPRILVILCTTADDERAFAHKSML